VECNSRIYAFKTFKSLLPRKKRMLILFYYLISLLRIIQKLRRTLLPKKWKDVTTYILY